MPEAHPTHCPSTRQVAVTLLWSNSTLQFTTPVRDSKALEICGSIWKLLLATWQNSECYNPIPLKGLQALPASNVVFDSFTGTKPSTNIVNT